MSKLTIFDPTRVFSDNFMKTFFDDANFNFNSYSAQVEMYEDEHNVVVKLVAPGFKSEQFDINVEDSVLTISAEASIESEEEDKKRKYYYKQIRSESFSRSMNLPMKVKAEEAKAEYKDGILAISLPKSEEVKPKKVTVQAS